MDTFTCDSCNKDSDFGRPEVVLANEWFRTRTPDEKVRRVYFCQHCGTKNDLELTPADWRLIDFNYVT